MSVIISCTFIIHVCCFTRYTDFFLCLSAKFYKSLFWVPILAAGGPYWVPITQKVGSLLVLVTVPRPLHRQTILANVAQQAILDNVAQQPTLLLKPQDMSSCGFKSNVTYQTTLTNVACQATLVNIVQRWNGLGKSMLPTRQYWMCPFAWIAALAQAISSNITQPKWDTLLGYNALITPPKTG